MKKLFLSLLPAIVLAASCSGSIVKIHDTASGELDYAAAVLENDRGRFDELNTGEYYGNGYFYIIDSRGIIIMHPEKALQGSDFSRFEFIRQILKKTSGCISFSSGGHKMSIYFRGLKNGEILCFTFESLPGKQTYTECRE